MNASTFTLVPSASTTALGTGAYAETHQRRPRLLDLFCGAGGASAGYHAAGFDVVGVDINPQPYYPFPFLQADALTVDLTGFDLIHASPPCQRWCQATPHQRRADHPDLLAPVRQRLIEATTGPDGPAGYVIENVPGAPMHQPVLVCGDTLRLGVRRHRLFESNLPLTGTGCWHDRTAPPVPVYGTYGQRLRRKPVEGETSLEGETSPSTGQARTAMGIDWMPWPALTQAIPPAYTHWLGVQLLVHLRDTTPELGENVTTNPRRGVNVTRDETRRRQPSHPDNDPDQVANVTRDATPPAGIRHRRCHCGNPLPPPPATGRWPRHCSHACRQAAYRVRRATRTGTHA